MNLVRRIAIALGVAGFMACCGAVLLFNRPTLGWQALSVPTGSMRPGLPPGSLVLVHRVPDSSLKVGDVITHINPFTMHSTLTHRIVQISHNHGVTTYITKGDANPSADLPVVGGLVQGRMVAHVPYLGMVLMWAKTWVGIAALVYLPSLIIMINETRRLAAYLRTIKPYRLFGFRPKPEPSHLKAKLAATAASVSMGVVLAATGWGAGWALTTTTTNTVALSPNHLSAAATTPPGSNCSNTTHVNFQNSSNQTSTSGNATSSGNTSGGSATSGNTNNTNSTNANITIQNNC
ncbi:MAG TPA: signal peptidase I [Candidatus Saccharimonadales bacterium]|nr:signal peptidase I [Candidatus Saccharimonadales bacterium]